MGREGWTQGLESCWGLRQLVHVHVSVSSSFSSLLLSSWLTAISPPISVFLYVCVSLSVYFCLFLSLSPLPRGSFSDSGFLSLLLSSQCIVQIYLPIYMWVRYYYSQFWFNILYKSKCWPVRIPVSQLQISRTENLAGHTGCWCQDVDDLECALHGWLPTQQRLFKHTF